MIKNFGAFTFEVDSNTVKPAQLCQFDTYKSVNENRADRKHVHKIRPCFLVDGTFEKSLARFPNKREIEAPQSQHSVYQQGTAMIFCNPGPIAAGCYFSHVLAKSILDALVHAITDLTTLGKDLNLDFGFCAMYVRNKDLTYKYKCDLTQELNTAGFEGKLRKSDRQTSDFWQADQKKAFQATDLGTMLPKKNQTTEKDQYQKTLALKIMSLDFNTTDDCKFSNK